MEVVHLHKTHRQYAGPGVGAFRMRVPMCRCAGVQPRAKVVGHCPWLASVRPTGPFVGRQRPSFRCAVKGIGVEGVSSGVRT